MLNATLDLCPSTRSLSLPTRGKFYILQTFFERASNMPNTNNEGFTVTPEALCVNGFKPAYYSDDNALNAHSLRRDTIPCGPFLGL